MDGHPTTNMLTEFEPGEEDFVRAITEFEMPNGGVDAIRDRVASGRPLSGACVALWFAFHNHARERVTLQKHPAEFYAGFLHHFGKAFPDGLAFPQPIEKYKLLPKSDSFFRYSNHISAWADALDLSHASRRPPLIKNINTVAIEAYKDIEKYARFVGKNPAAKTTVNAQLMLPSQCRSTTGREVVASFKAWLKSVWAKGGQTTLRELSSKIYGSDTVEQVKVKKQQDIRERLLSFGVGISPEPSFVRGQIGVDDLIVIYQGERALNEEAGVSDAYRHAWLEVCLSVFLAQYRPSTGLNDVLCEGLTLENGPSRSLADHECKRLVADFKRMTLVPLDPPAWVSAGVDLPHEHKERLKAVIFELVRREGQAAPEFMKRAEFCYRVMGQPVESLYGAVHEILSGQPRRPASMNGSEVQDRPTGTPLDHEAIRSLKQATTQAGVLLDGLFADESTEVIRPTAETAAKDYPPAHLVPLIRACIEREAWDEQALFTLFNEHGQMPAAALEMLNEWCFEAIGLEFLELDDSYSVSPETAQAVRDFLDKKGSRIRPVTGQ